MSEAITPTIDAQPIRNPRSILFLCGMNAIRSPMAEAIAKSVLPKDVFIASAGVHKGEPDPFVAAILHENGLSSPNRAPHQPHTLDELEDDYFDLIVTLAPEAHHRALELTRSQPVDVEYWPLPDPSLATGTRDQILDAYRQVRNTLESRIRSRFSSK
jgi:protein-tyrosine-phosphatase